MTCCSVRRSGPSPTARFMWRVSFCSSKATYHILLFLRFFFRENVFGEFVQKLFSGEFFFFFCLLLVSGASIDIKCETNGDIDAMDCSWKNTQWTKPKFQYR